MGRRPIKNVSFEADSGSTDSSRIIDQLSDIYIDPAELSRRGLLPKPENLAQHRIDSNERGNAIQWVQRSANSEPVPSYVVKGPDGLEIGKALVTEGKQKLAKNDRSPKGRERQRYALDLELLANRFFPDMSNKEITQRAGTKYEYINARGNEAHHMFPISYIGKVLNKLEQMGIDGPVIDEMVRRKIAVGDVAPNLISAQTKATPGREFLDVQDKSNVEDKHDVIHATAEDFLESLNLPQQNKGAYRLEDFMDDPNVTDYQKQAYAMALAESHRLAVQAAQLDPTKVRNQKRLMDTIVRVAADKNQAQMKLSPLSQKLLQQVHNQSF